MKKLTYIFAVLVGLFLTLLTYTPTATLQYANPSDGAGIDHEYCIRTLPSSELIKTEQGGVPLSYVRTSRLQSGPHSCGAPEQPEVDKSAAFQETYVKTWQFYANVALWSAPFIGLAFMYGRKQSYVHHGVRNTVSYTYGRLSAFWAFIRKARTRRALACILAASAGLVLTYKTYTPETNSFYKTKTDEAIAETDCSPRAVGQDYRVDSSVDGGQPLRSSRHTGYEIKTTHTTCINILVDYISETRLASVIKYYDRTWQFYANWGIWSAPFAVGAYLYTKKYAHTRH